MSEPYKNVAIWNKDDETRKKKNHTTQNYYWYTVEML